jgi:NAD(P)-dependent dehydrogenase (short-subunit alcohol dehydrogenase family)
MVLAALPHMRNQGAGRIVNISSIGGRIAVPHMVPYSASKFALTGLSDGLRAELAHENIIVTTVCPGLMRTGSPVNADFKGRQAQEYSWFAVSSSLPGMTIGAERAARQIVNACRNGDAELVITVLVPELFGEAMSLINRLLPSVAGRDGDAARLAGRLRLGRIKAAGPDVRSRADEQRIVGRWNLRLGRVAHLRRQLGCAAPLWVSVDQVDCGDVS